MFVLDLSPTYTVPITVHVRDAAGHQQPGTFQAELLRMGPDAFEAYQKTISEQNLSDQDIARHVLCGWSEMTDADGAPVPFNAVTRDALIGRVTGAASAIASAWHRSVMEDVRKNLLPPDATGPAADQARTTSQPTPAP